MTSLPLLLVFLSPVLPAAVARGMTEAEAIRFFEGKGAVFRQTEVAGEMHSGLDMESAGLIKPEDLAMLKFLPNLSYLISPPTSGECLEYLRHVPNLKGLHVPARCRCDDASLAHLANTPHLRRLFLSGGGTTTDKAWQHLARLTELEDLTLSDNAIADAGLVNLKSFPRLKHLSLDRIPISNTAMEHVARIHHLQRLMLLDLEITDTGMESLEDSSSLISLHLLDLNITDEGLEHLTGLTELQFLQLRGGNITDPGIKHLSKLPKLQGLMINSVNISDQGLESLLSLKNLEDLWLNASGVTRTGAYRFKILKPECAVRHDGMLLEPALRTWHDATGEYEVEAATVEMQSGKVTLVRENGQLVEVELERLSEADKVYLRESGFLSEMTSAPGDCPRMDTTPAVDPHGTAAPPARSAEAVVPLASNASPLPARSWTDNEGHSFDAHLLRVEGDQIVFRSAKTGELSRWPLAHLSESDREFATSTYELVKRLRHPRLGAQASEQLVTVGVDAVPVLIEELGHGRGWRKSLQTLVKIGEPAIPYLLRVDYESEAARARWKAADKRLEEAGELARARRQSIEDEVIGRAYDPVVEALLQMPAAALLAALQHEDEGLRRRFIRPLPDTIRGAGDERIVNLLATMCENEEEAKSVRDAAWDALAAVAQRDWKRPPLRAIRFFEEQCKSKDPSVRLEAAAALCVKRAVGPKNVGEVIALSFAGGKGNYSLTPRADAQHLVLSTIADVLSESDDVMAHHAASKMFFHHLKITPEAAMVPDLIRLVEYRDSSCVSAKAAEYLGKLGPNAKMAVPALIDWLERSEPEQRLSRPLCGYQRGVPIDALRKIGLSEPGVIDALLKAATDSCGHTCEMIVTAFRAYRRADRSQLERLQSAMWENKRLDHSWRTRLLREIRFIR